LVLLTAEVSKYAASCLLARHSSGQDTVQADVLAGYTQKLAAAGYPSAFGLLSLTSVDQVRQE
jgi:hypothetical protein